LSGIGIVSVDGIGIGISIVTGIVEIQIVVVVDLKIEHKEWKIERDEGVRGLAYAFQWYYWNFYLKVMEEEKKGHYY